VRWFALFFFLVCFIACDEEHLNPRDKYFKQKFNDVQSVQLPTAKKLGIQPQNNRQGVESNKKLVSVKSGNGFAIANLTHSSSKVLPETKKLIQDIGKQFLDSVKGKGLFSERAVVTSLTRSKEDQKKLSKGNLNAARQSAHFYGTTFDISYIQFYRDKNVKRDILANVLDNLRKEKRCWVKYEIQQKCFHITVR
jgi:hypothetical protein